MRRSVGYFLFSMMIAMYLFFATGISSLALPHCNCDHNITVQSHLCCDNHKSHEHCHNCCKFKKPSTKNDQLETFIPTFNGNLEAVDTTNIQLLTLPQLNYRLIKPRLDFKYKVNMLAMLRTVVLLN